MRKKLKLKMDEFSTEIRLHFFLLLRNLKRYGVLHHIINITNFFFGTSCVYGRREIAPTGNWTHLLNKECIKSFPRQNLKRFTFRVKLSDSISFLLGLLVDIIGLGMKPIPGDQESNFKKVGAIPSEPV